MSTTLLPASVQLYIGKFLDDGLVPVYADEWPQLFTASNWNTQQERKQALIAACKTGDVDMVRYCLQRTPLDLSLDVGQMVTGAVKSGSADALQLVLGVHSPAKDYARHCRALIPTAIQRGYCEVLQVLLASGCPYDVRSWSKAACAQGRLDMVQTLLHFAFIDRPGCEEEDLFTSLNIVLEAAVKAQDKAIVQWTVRQKTFTVNGTLPWPTVEARARVLSEALHRRLMDWLTDPLPYVQWLIDLQAVEAGYRWVDGASVARRMYRHGWYEALNLAILHGCPLAEVE